jgi:hypothetical protein
MKEGRIHTSERTLERFGIRKVSVHRFNCVAKDCLDFLYIATDGANADAPRQQLLHNWISLRSCCSKNEDFVRALATFHDKFLVEL